jgi:hypothetical protein
MDISTLITVVVVPVGLGTGTTAWTASQTRREDQSSLIRRRLDCGRGISDILVQIELAAVTPELVLPLADRLGSEIGALYETGIGVPSEIGAIIDLYTRLTADPMPEPQMIRELCREAQADALSLILNIGTNDTRLLRAPPTVRVSRWALMKRRLHSTLATLRGAG